MSESDKILLKRAQKGDIEAFQELIQIHQKNIFNLSLKMIGNYEDALELTQEVLIKLFKNLKKFKGDSKFSTWVYRITTNQCLDFLRKNSKINNVTYVNDYESENKINEVKQDKYLPEDELIKKEENKVIQSALNHLNENHRIVIILRELNGYSYEEISKIIKEPIGTIKSRINRARIILRDFLKPNLELFKDKKSQNKKGGD